MDSGYRRSSAGIPGRSVLLTLLPIAAIQVGLFVIRFALLGFQEAQDSLLRPVTWGFGLNISAFALLAAYLAQHRRKRVRLASKAVFTILVMWLLFQVTLPKLAEAWCSLTL